MIGKLEALESELNELEGIVKTFREYKRKVSVLAGEIEELETKEKELVRTILELEEKKESLRMFCVSKDELFKRNEFLNQREISINELHDEAYGLVRKAAQKEIELAEIRKNNLAEIERKKEMSAEAYKTAIAEFERQKKGIKEIEENNLRVLEKIEIAQKPIYVYVRAIQDELKKQNCKIDVMSIVNKVKI